MAKMLTVFTPSYNRAHTLERLYESLCRQTSQDFCWLIIDDGSTDSTRALVESWIAEERIEMRYLYQENQGMHSAHNTAYAHIDTLLNTCIDSDDFLPDNAVELILRCWEERGSMQWAGIIGLDIDTERQLIGTPFAPEQLTTTLHGFYARGGRGDKKLVYRTEVVRQYPPYPLFEGEKYVGLAALYYQIDRDYRLLTLNEPLVCVDYQPDGSSRTMWQQYWNNPQGFLYFRTIELGVTHRWWRRWLIGAHAIAHALRAKRWDALRALHAPLLLLFAFPLGGLLYVYTRYKVR